MAYLDDMMLNYDYDRKIKTIVEYVNELNNPYDKLKTIYTYLVKKCNIDYDYLKPKYRSGKYAYPIIYPYKGVNGVSNLATSTNKYGPILFEKGVCKGFTEAFLDIAKKCNLNVYEVKGEHFGFAHSWIVVNYKNELHHIDVYSGIQNKERGYNIYKSFMVPTKKLNRKKEYVIPQSVIEQDKKIKEKNKNKTKKLYRH